MPLLVSYLSPTLLRPSAPGAYRTLTALCGLVMALAPASSLAQRPVVVDVVPVRSLPGQPLKPPTPAQSNRPRPNSPSRSPNAPVMVDTIPAGSKLPRPSVNPTPPGQPSLPTPPNPLAPPGISLPQGAIGHQREFRGIWVTAVNNIDWPSRQGLSAVQQQAELVRLLEQMQALNLNALILQVRPASDALYNSPYEPWSSWLTGTQGQSPGYDPLEFAIRESHKRNIEVHAWFNPYRARVSPTETIAPNHISQRYPQYTYRYGNQLWMDPGAKEVQDWTYTVILDVVRRYDIDGVHLDDYFYPYPQSGVSFPDSQTYAAYRQAGGSLSLADWRRDNVNQLVQRLATGIRGTKPHVKFGISPFGIYRPGQPAGIQGLDQYNALYADPKLWLQQGWVDYLAPQLYWRIDPPQQSYATLLNWWSQQNSLGRHIYAGNYLSQLDGKAWGKTEFERQVALSRQKAAQNSLGNIFFSAKVLRDNRLGIHETFKTSLYPSPALPPTMPWLDNIPPAPPTGVQARAGQLTWNAGNADVRGWTLYRQQGPTWQLVQLLNANTTSIPVLPGTYALQAVDRLANESRPIVVTVAN